MITGEQMDLNLAPVIREILDEGLDDWVTIDTVIAEAREFGDVYGEDLRTVFLSLLRTLLSEGLMVYGGLGENGFEPSGLGVEGDLSHVLGILDRCHWSPQGAAGWLGLTEKGSQVAETYGLPGIGL